jgi:hypothetical protein
MWWQAAGYAGFAPVITGDPPARRELALFRNVAIARNVHTILVSPCQPQG